MIAPHHRQNCIDGVRERRGRLLFGVSDRLGYPEKSVRREPAIVGQTDSIAVRRGWRGQR
jgi:hypothetical protein